MINLTVGSLFSGAAGFEQGFEQAGFRTAWQFEIDKDATDVLERHYPNVRRFKDVREIDPADLEPVDVITFGSPCQGFSVAGKGEGLEDVRSGLFYEAVRIISGVRPAFAVWENVPGAYSANDGRDFGAVLSALAELGALDICWRVLDAQWFGVPQRRRRVFLVADFGGERAISVLFESESVRGDSQAGSEARQGAARDAENGAGGSGVANSLLSYAGRNQLAQTYVPMSGEAVAHCLTAHGGSHGRIDAESETFVVAAFDERQVTSKANRTTVERGADGPTLNGGAGMSVVGFTNRGLTTDDNAHETMRASSHGAIPMASTGMSVRRLTPVECERLQGFPDNWTRWRADGSEIPDGARYRLMGNAVAVPVAFWIAQRMRAALEAT